MGTRHLYWILTGPSFAVKGKSSICFLKLFINHLSFLLTDTPFLKRQVWARICRRLWTLRHRVQESIPNEKLILTWTWDMGTSTSNLFPTRFQESIFHPLTRLQIPAQAHCVGFHFLGTKGAPCYPGKGRIVISLSYFNRICCTFLFKYSLQLHF
jgi:hypothetical protein